MVREVVGAAHYIRHTLFNYNFSEVSPGEFYRAKRMPTKELLNRVRHHRIKTVIDFSCGAEKKDEQGFTEKELLEKNGVSYIHIPLTNSRPPTYNRMEHLLRIYREAQPPFLVHCTSGTHRSGYASFLWILQKKGAGILEALKQLSPRFGYFKWERRLHVVLEDGPGFDQAIWKFIDANRRTDISFDAWMEDHLERETIYPPVPGAYCSY